MGQTPEPLGARVLLLSRAAVCPLIASQRLNLGGGERAGLAPLPPPLAARARSAAPGRPWLQPEPDSRRRRRHLRLLPREGGGPPIPEARTPGSRKQGKAGTPLTHDLHGSHIHRPPPSCCYPSAPVLKFSRGSSGPGESVCWTLHLVPMANTLLPTFLPSSLASSKTCAFRTPLPSISSSCPVESHLPPSHPQSHGSPSLFS